MANLKRNLWLLPVVAGCYSYTPITPAAAPTGSEVRARITGAASDRVGPLLHSFDTRVLIGNVVENNAGAMVLQVPLGAMSNVSETIVPLQTRVPLTAADLVSLEQRRVDPIRTTLLVGGIGAGIAAGIAVAIRASGKSEPGKTPEEPPPIVRIPLWRFHFP
jgi:hypothetical protein